MSDMISNQTCTECHACGTWTNYADDAHYKARVAEFKSLERENAEQYRWDYAQDCAVPEEEMPEGSERDKASERAKWAGKEIPGLAEG